MPLRITDKTVNEGSTCKITFLLTDYAGNAVSVGAISTATFTLKDRITGDTINSRTNIDCKSNFDVNGNFSLILTAADNVIRNSATARNTVRYEEHIFTITVNAVVNSETIVLQESISIQVANLTYKP